MSVHPIHAAAPAPASAVREPPSSRPARGISELRHEGRRVASVMVRSAGALAPIARALEVSPSAAEHWADPEHEAAMTLGDILALAKRAPNAAEAILVAALSHVQSTRTTHAAPLPPMAAAASLLKEAGELVGAVLEAEADGTMTPEEARHCLREFVDVEQRMPIARRALMARAGGL